MHVKPTETDERGNSNEILEGPHQIQCQAPTKLSVGLSGQSLMMLRYFDVYKM